MSPLPFAPGCGGACSARGSGTEGRALHWPAGARGLCASAHAFLGILPRVKVGQEAARLYERLPLAGWLGIWRNEM